MTSLISNKHKKLEYAKKPTKFLKQLSARKLRRKTFDEYAFSEFTTIKRHHKYVASKHPANCPICLERLQKNARGTRYLYACAHCLAQWTSDLKCFRCNTFRVWRNKKEARCKGCGHFILSFCSN